MANEALNEGLQIDLDSGMGRILKGKTIDDFRSPCTQLEIAFECQERLRFTGTDASCYFHYRTIDWVPIAYNEYFTNEHNWHYEIEALPFCAFIMIKSPCESIEKLAREMGLKLINTSDSLTIDFATINVYSGEFVQELRRRSCNQAYLDGRMDDMWMLYFNSTHMLSNRMSTVMKAQARTIEVPNGMQGTSIISNCDQTIKNYYSANKLWGKWNLNDYILRLFGNFVSMNSPTPAAFGVTYTIKFGDTDSFDKEDPYICFRVESDITDSTKWNTVFAKMNNFKREG